MNFKISDICEINSSNISAKDNYEYINYLDTSNLTEGVIDSIQKLVIGEDKIPSRAKRKVKKNDILISTVRPNQKHYGILRKLRENLIVSTGFAVLSVNKDKVDAEYLYRFLTQDSVTNYLQAIGETSTSTYPSIKPSDIGNLDIKLPTLQEQKAIAKVLSDLDEKIETNNKINKALEEMAQAIFKQWFVDFEFPNEEGKPYKSSGGEMVESELGKIPKKWKVVKLHEIGNLTMGLSPKSESYNTTGEGIPLLNGAADFSGGLIKANKYTTQKTRLCKVKDLVFCIRATIGNITFADREYCLGRGVASIGSKEDLYIGLIYMNLLKSIEKLKAQATGSVILGLSKPDINDMKLILPTNDILNKYSNLFNSVFDKKHALELENDKLISIRDTLLPKLMSGEIRVPLNLIEN